MISRFVDYEMQFRTKGFPWNLLKQFLMQLDGLLKKSQSGEFLLMRTITQFNGLKARTRRPFSCSGKKRVRQ